MSREKRQEAALAFARAIYIAALDMFLAGSRYDAPMTPQDVLTVTINSAQAAGLALFVEGMTREQAIERYDEVIAAERAQRLAESSFTQRAAFGRN